jgi:hypothetical protein
MNSNQNKWVRDKFNDQGLMTRIFFIVMGDFKDMDPMDVEKYKSSGMPDGFSAFPYRETQHEGLKRDICSGYIWDFTNKFRPELCGLIHQTTSSFLLRGDQKEQEDLDYLKEIVGFVAYLLDNGGIAVYDPLLLKWWNKKEWMEEIFKADGPAPFKHVEILKSPENEDPTKTWYHTRGMIKFGKPELSIRNMGKEQEEDALKLINKLIEYQCQGGAILKEHTVELDGSLKGYKYHLQGHWDDPDFNNVHIDIRK